MCKQDDDVKSPPSSSSGHNTGDAGNRLPVPSICTSLCLTYPRAIFCSTFLYMEAGYALRNILFCMTFLCRLVRIVGIPISLFVYYSDTGDSWAWLLTAFGTIATMTIGQILSARFAEFKKFAHLPGPKPSFFFGNYRDLCKTGWGDRHHTLLELHEIYGPILRMHMPLFKRPFVYCNFIPDVIHDKSIDALRPSMFLTLGSLMGVRLGPRHSRNRHHLSKIKGVANFKVMLESVDVVTKDIVEDMTNALKRGEEPGELDSTILEWSLDAMFLYLYDCKPETSEKKQEVIAAVDMFVGEISRRTNQPMWMWYNSWDRIKEYTTGLSFLLNMAKEMRELEDAPLDSYMKQKGVKNFEALDELTIMLAASFESTAHTVCQCLIMLAKDHECQSKVAAEAKKILEQAGDGPITKELTDSCTYIQHCIFEALRLHPTIPFSAQKMTKSFSVDVNGKQIDVPGKCYLTYFKTAIGINPALFEDAEAFKPERYDGMKSRAEKQSSFLPFGTGPRQCWGQLIAEMQMVQLLDRMLGSLEFHNDTSWASSIVDGSLDDSGRSESTRVKRKSVAAVSVAAPCIRTIVTTLREDGVEMRSPLLGKSISSPTSATF